MACQGFCSEGCRVRIPTTAKIVAVISCAPWQGCLNLLSASQCSYDAYQSMVEPPQRPSAGAMGHHPRCFARNIYSLQGAMKKRKKKGKPPSAGIYLSDVVEVPVRDLLLTGRLLQFVEKAVQLILGRQIVESSETKRLSAQQKNLLLTRAPS